MTSTAGIKRFVYVFDLICMLLGLVLVAFGIYIICAHDTNEMGAMAAYAYIGIGAAAIVVFLFGGIAASHEHVCCTVTFITFLYIVIIAQLIVTFLLTNGDKTIASNLANELDNAWETELKSPGAMSFYESRYNCCGRASPQDYIVNERLPPATCFRDQENTKPEKLIDSGCRIAFENYWIQLLQIFHIISWVLIGLELIGSIVACCLCNSIRNDNRRSYF